MSIVSVYIIKDLISFSCVYSIFTTCDQVSLTCNNYSRKIKEVLSTVNNVDGVVNYWTYRINDA